MSETRCGLQISRDITLTNEVHNHPREKQIGCLINGNILTPDESMGADDFTATTANNELLNQRDIKAAQRQNAQAQTLGFNDLALGNITANISKLTSSLVEGMDEQKGVGRHSRANVYNQGGKGFTSIIGKLTSLLPVKKIGQSVAATISNAFPDSDENARNIFPGENHAIVKLPNDKFGRANYTGPGTRVIERLRRGDPPRVLSDKVSKAHDIRYTLADSIHNVREADLKMLSSLKRLSQEGSDRSINIAPAMLGIRGKIALEDFGLLSRDAFVDTSVKQTPADEKLLRDELWNLEQEGFGNLSKGSFIDRSGGQYAGDLLRKPLLTRSQVMPFKNPTMRLPPVIAKFSSNQPQFLNSEPGTSSTQSLVGTWSSNREVQLDRRTGMISQRRLPTQITNTRSSFGNRMSDTNQTGSGQVPGQPAPPSSEVILQKQQVTRQNEFEAKQPNRLMNEQNRAQGGKGFPGVNPIQINIRPKLMIPIAKQFDKQKGKKSITIPIAVPGKRLLKKMDRKIQSRKMGMFGRGQLANQFKQLSLSKRMAAVPKPLFMDEHEAAHFAANMIMPVIRVN